MAGRSEPADEPHIELIHSYRKGEENAAKYLLSLLS